MRVAFLISGNRTPSSRFRILAFLPYLRSRGCHCSVFSSFPQKYDYFPFIGFRPSQLLKRLVRRWHLSRIRLGRFDVVYLERELFDDDTSTMERRLRRITDSLVLDVDDAVFLRYPQKIEALTRMADLVIAGNRFIDAHVAQWNSNTVIIPTGVDLAQYPEKDAHSTNSDLPVVGWMGTTGNLAYFSVIAPALRKLAQRCEFEMRFIAPDAEPLQQIDLEGVRTRHIVWQGSREVDDLREIDIGVMPLFPDREWDKYKCPTKLVQYMAIGVPGIASPVGFTADVVTPGIDGFLASTAEEWEETLYSLVRDAELRRRVGQAARKTVAAKYSVQANGPVLLDALARARDIGATAKRGGSDRG